MANTLGGRNNHRGADVGIGCRAGLLLLRRHDFHISRDEFVDERPPLTSDARRSRCGVKAPRKFAKPLMLSNLPGVSPIRYELIVKPARFAYISYWMSSAQSDDATKRCRLVRHPLQAGRAHHDVELIRVIEFACVSERE